MTFIVGRFANVPRSLLLVCLFTASSALAQISVITGTVTDAATKQPLADAVVTATSPSLQGEQVVVTDATGLYRVPQLPPGTYTIRVEKEAYKPYSRGEIELRADVTLRLNVELLPEALKEEVVVVGRAPTVDVGSSALSTTVTSDFVRNLALSRPGGRGGASRSFESLALVAPTAQTDTYGISLNGTTSNENGYLLDGSSVSNPGFGLLGSPVPAEFLEEVNVITGGYMPEYGRSIGGVLSAVTKSGSNEYHGSIWGNWTPGSLEGSATEVKRQGTAVSVIPSVHNIGDVGGTIGGPIMKDKLWFFAGFEPSFARFKLTRYFNQFQFQADGFTPQTEDPNNPRSFIVTRRIDAATQTFFADKKVYNYIAKLTYLINQDNRVSASVLGTPSTSGGNGTYSLSSTTGLPPAALNGSYNALAAQVKQSSTDVILKWNSSFLEKRLLIDATGSVHLEHVDALPSDGSSIGGGGLASVPLIQYRRTATAGTATAVNRTNHSLLDFPEGIPADVLAGPCANRMVTLPSGAPRIAVPCPVTQWFNGGPGFIDVRDFKIWQGKLIVTYLLQGLGHHVLKAGFDGKVLYFDHDKAYTGGVYFREATNGASFSDFREYGYLQGPDNPVFMRDLVTNVNTSVVGGFVQDSWSIMDVVTLNVGVRYDSQTANGNGGSPGFTLNNQWSPRIGLVYDFTQQGRSKLYANYARFYEDVPLDALDRAFPGERQIQTVGRSCNPAVPGNNCRDPSSLNVKDNTDNNVFWIPISSDRDPVDPNLSAQSSDELVIGAEYEVLPSARAGVSYTRRYLNRVIEDMSNDEGVTLFLGNPGYGIASGFPKAVRNYNAVTVSFTKSFADLWMAQASYTYSTLVGNYAGLFRPETGQLDPNINSDFDLKSLLPNRSGNLPGDYTHQIKVFAAKEFVVTGALSVTPGVTYLGRSGGPISYLGSHPVYGAGEAFILPRGAAGRLPWIHTVDPHLGVNYRFSRDMVLTVNVDVFNLFNFQNADLADNNFTLVNVLPIPGGTTADLPTQNPASPGKLRNSDGTPFDPAGINPNFRNATRYQPPRSVRFGARLTF